MKLSEVIGKTLDDLISKKGLNYLSYSQKAGVTQGYVSKVINGTTTNIKIDTLEKLCLPLEISVAEFLFEVEKKNPLLA